jgi:hypothetical protein
MSMLLGTHRSLFGKRQDAATYAEKVLSYHPFAYYQMDEVAGLVAVDSSMNGYDGTYNAVTLANAPGPFGGMAPLFDPAAGIVYVDLLAAAAAFNRAEGAIVIAAQMFNAGVWTDGAYHYFVRVALDGNNYVAIYKSNTNNRLVFRRTAGGTNRLRNKDGVSETGWMILGLDWSESGNSFTGYYQGIQEGAALAADAFAAGAITIMAAGCSDITGAGEHYGWLSQLAFFNAPLGAAGHLDLASI